MRLTKPQKLIYDMEKFAGGSISVICGSILINGVKDIPILKHALNELYRLNDALRIRICETDNNVSQKIADYDESEIDVLYFDSKEELDSYAENYAKMPIDLYGKLCELTIVILPDQCGALAKLHHLIGDAWTLSLLANQFYSLVNCEVPKAYSYTNYLENENNYLLSKRYNKDKDFFLDQFSKCDEVTYLSDKQGNSFSANRKTFLIDEEQAKIISEYASKNNTSVFVLFTAALVTYINRVKMNAEKFYIGTAVLNRNSAKEKHTAGMFVNTVPMLIELDNNKSFAENLSLIEKTAFSIFRHQRHNYGDVLSAIRNEYSFAEKLYDVIISYQNATVTGNEIKTTWYHCGMQTESLQVHIDDRDKEGIFNVHYDYLVDCFTKDEIELLHRHIINLLFSAIEDDNKKLYELNLLTDCEKQKLFSDFNNTALDYPRDKCVHQLFEEQAEKTPDKIAVIFENEQITYKQLDEMSNSLAHYLRNKGVKRNEVVPIIMKRHWLLFVAILAVNKAGGAFMCIDTNYPEDRINYMLKEVNAQTVLIFNYCLNKNAQCLDLSTFDYTSNPFPICSVNNIQDLTYLIFTSGSTGFPKALMIKHINANNFCNSNEWNVSHKIINDDNCVFLSVTNIIFDMFITECFVPLTNGYTILFANDAQTLHPYELEQLCQTYKPDIIETTPTKMESYISDIRNFEYIKNIKLMILGGEALTKSLLCKLQSITNANIFNNYGPAETTVWSTIAPITNCDIHIGKPIANTQIYIVDKYMEPTPIGVTGELCVAGDGVGAGYLNRPELTAEKFIDNPFGKGKLYKTGDLAYWREDGNIVYVGRNDFQVKIRGLRIELGEIENAICGIDGISQSVAVVRKNDEGRQLICAFYTGNEIDAKEIRRIIGKKLPKYMLPHIFTHLDKMPLTSSGKINRKALPEVDLYNISTDNEYIAPTTEMEKALCRITEDVLKISSVGVTNDFFENGGDSLKAIEFVSKAHSEGIYFNLQNMFDYPTVRGLCEYIDNGDKPTISYDDIDFSKVDAILQKNTFENISRPDKSEVGNILLAGATGYLGIHILSNFLDNDSGIAYCLIRGKDKEDSKNRFANLLKFYFGEKYSNHSRIKVICADLQKDRFGLTDNDYADLLKKVNTVINCAASVKHYGSYKYFYEANVETTKRLIDFCKESGARLVHASTLSVSGNSFGDQFDGYISDKELHFYEYSLYINQPLDNVYARSKFEAEKAVLDAMSNGLQANIMRMGNLTNRTDGMFQINYKSNAFLKRVKAIIDMGVIPDYLLAQYVEFTPIDEAADAVMTITRHFSNEQTVFHINSTNGIYLDKLNQYIKQLGYPMEAVSGNVFTSLLRETAEKSGSKYIFETFINDMNNEDKLVYDSNIRIKNQFTEKYLYNLGFEWSEIGIEYLKRYFDYFRKIGYIGE